MSGEVIVTRGLTKDYGGGRGVFALDLSVRRGEIFGFLGPNGAGKTTTIRQLMGFVRPDGGSASILGMPCFESSAAIHAHVGYLPGDLALMDSLSGGDFIRFMADMRGLRDLNRAEELTDRFQLDGSAKIRRMSKGTRQKVGLVCAFMARPDLLILDEPTSGLDPLMQNRFIDLLLEEKARGATVLLSSHIFEEVERTCDRAAILRGGRLVSVETAQALGRGRTVRFTLADEAAARAMVASVRSARQEGRRVSALLTDPAQLPALLGLASAFPVVDLETSSRSLEELFLHFYGGDKP